LLPETILLLLGGDVNSPKSALAEYSSGAGNARRDKLSLAPMLTPQRYPWALGSSQDVG